MRESADVTFATKRMCKKVGLPGWNDSVKPSKEKNIFCHNIWINAGYTHIGQLDKSANSALTNFLEDNKENKCQY